MRAVARILLICFTLSGCKEEVPRWETSSEPPRVVYSFAHPSGGYFAGQCFGAPQGPIFALWEGDYPDDINQFEINVDGRQWTLDVFRGQHGGGLLLESSEIIRALAYAQKKIVISVGDHWERRIPPDRRLFDFFQACISLPGYGKKPWPQR